MLKSLYLESLSFVQVTSVWRVILYFLIIKQTINHEKAKYSVFYDDFAYSKC